MTNFFLVLERFLDIIKIIRDKQCILILVDEKLTTSLSKIRTV